MKIYRFLFIIFCLTACLAEGQSAGAGQWVRPAVLAGMWYPGDRAGLVKSIDAYLGRAKALSPPAKTLAIITPHAGHIYSGSVAGAAWALAASLRPRPATVILVGPSHHFRLLKPSIWPQGAYDSPLGRVEVDHKLAGQLAKSSGAIFNQQAHLREHCLEVQVPFLARALPGTKLVPVLTGSTGLEEARSLGEVLAMSIRGKPVLLAASTDLSHFHEEKTALILDKRVAGRVRALDPEGLYQLAAQGKAEACGLQALAAVIFAARRLGAEQGRILEMATSARTNQDTSRVVGYLAAALTGPVSTKNSGAKKEEFVLDTQLRRLLKELARRTIAAAVQGRPLPAPPSGYARLREKCGVFVTLRRQGRLRGCMGMVLPVQALGAGVVEMAATAALRDPRFRPVQAGELNDMDLEISVLTPLRPVRPEQVRVGVHGLMIQLGRRSGLLLPQVPGEMGWNRLQYLEGLCAKAGLPVGAWKDPRVKLHCFRALVF